MSNIHKISASGGLRIPVLAADPVSPEKGLIWYNSTDDIFRQALDGGTIADIGDSAALDALVTLSGVAANATDLGTFTGTTIPDSSDIKEALQALETEVETKADASHTHVAADVTDFSSAAQSAVVIDSIADADATHAPSRNAVFDALAGKADTSHTHVAADVTDFSSAAQSAVVTQSITNGVTATAPSEDAVYDALAGKAAVSHSHAISDVTGLQTALDNKVDDSQIGAANGVASLDANSLIPIAQIPPAALERLVIVADQTARFALTTTTVQNGDTVKQTDTGVMYFVKDDANLDSAAGYSEYTAGTASAVDWSGVTNTPTTLAGYGITDDALPGDLDAAGNVIHDDTGIRFGDTASTFYVEQYYPSLILTASSTNAVESSLSFAHATYEGLIVEYKIKEATTNRLRVGVLMITSDGTNTSIVDNCTESADVGVTWNLNVNGATTEVRYTTTANNKAMKAIVKKIVA